MLKKLEIENFKAFPRFELTCRDFNLLIEENNNGKSALIDALKLVSISLSYQIYRNPVITILRAS